MTHHPGRPDATPDATLSFNLAQSPSLAASPDAGAGGSLPPTPVMPATSYNHDDDGSSVGADVAAAVAAARSAMAAEIAAAREEEAAEAAAAIGALEAALATATARVAELEDQDRVVSELRVALEQADTALAVQAQDAAAAQARAVQDAVKAAVAAAVEERDTNHEEALADLAKDADDLRAAVASATASRDAALLQMSSMAMAVDNEADDSGGQAAYAAAATAAKLEAQLAREKEESERLALELAATGKEKGKLEAKLASQRESHARELKELREDFAQSQRDDVGDDDDNNANTASGTVAGAAGDEGDGQGSGRRGRRGVSTTGGGAGGGGSSKFGGTRGKSRGRSVLSRSPSIDPISRMVAQLPERERTAHLATELVAAQERAKAKEVAVAAAEKDAKSLRGELALLKAAKTESDRKLAALMAYTPASARKAQAAAAAAAAASSSTAAGGSQQAGFPRNNNNTGNSGNDGGAGSTQGGDAATEAARADAAEAALETLEAEVEGLKAARAAAEETAASLREELDEAQEDAALLKQLNEMDQLTIGSLQQGASGSGRSSLAGGSASGRQSRDNTSASGAGTTPALPTVDEGSQSSVQQQIADAEAKVAEVTAAFEAKLAAAEAKIAAAEAAAAQASEEFTAAAASANAAEARASAAEARAREAEAQADSEAKTAAKAKKDLAAATADSSKRSSRQSKTPSETEASATAEAKKSAAALAELEAQVKRDEAERRKLEKVMQNLQSQLVEAEQEIYAARAEAATAHSERAAAVASANAAPGGIGSSASSSSTTAGPSSLAWGAPLGAEENESFWAQEEARLAAAPKNDPLENVSGMPEAAGSKAHGNDSSSGGSSNMSTRASSMAYKSAAVLGKAFFGQQASTGDRSGDGGLGKSADDAVAGLKATARTAFESARVSFARTSSAGVQAAPSNGAAGIEAEATGGTWREVSEACARAEEGFLPVGLALTALAQQQPLGRNASGSTALPEGWKAGPAGAAPSQATWSTSAAATAGRVVSAELARRSSSSHKAAAEDGHGACVSADDFVDMVTALHVNAGSSLASQAGGKTAGVSSSTGRAAEVSGILKDVAAHDLAVWCTRRLRQHERSVVSQGRATAARLAAARSSSSRKGAESARGAKVEVKVVRAVRLGSDGNPCEGEVDSIADFTLQTAGGEGAGSESQWLTLPPWSTSLSSVDPPCAAHSELSFSVPPSSSSSRRGRSNNNNNAANLELSGVLTARSATADDAALGSFVLPLSDLASRLPIAAWGQRWCTAEINSDDGSSSSSDGAVLLLVRVRLLPSPEASLATELQTARKVLKNLVHAREEAYLPLANELASRAVVALRRRVNALMAKQRGQPNGEGASLLEWWLHDLSPRDRQAWLGGIFAASGVVIALAAGTPSHSWLGRRARALVLLVQAAATWEFADRMGDVKAGWAVAVSHAFGVRASFFTMASAVAKVAVTAAIFHGMLVLLGASGGGGSGGGSGLGGSYYSADALTPLLWVWFFGVVTGHLVFGRMQQQEALDFLRVDMEEARAALAKAEAEADALADEAAQEATSTSERLDASRNSFDSALDETAATSRSLLEGDSTVSYTHLRNKNAGGAEEWKAGAGEEGFSEDSTVEGEVGSMSELDDRSFRR